MKERGSKLTGFRKAAGSAVLAMSIAACGNNNPTETPKPTINPTEQPTPTLITPTETPVFTAEPTPKPTAKPTPEATPSVTKITDGTSFYENYNEWRQTNPDSVNPTEYKTNIESFIKDNLSTSTDQDLSTIYKLLTTDDALSTKLGLITSGKSSTGEFVGACSDMITYMTFANNKGIEGSIDYAYKAEVLCDGYAKKRNMDTDFLHGEITKALDRVL